MIRGAKMEEVVNQEQINRLFEQQCVFCENLDYKKQDYESLCYQHKKKLLWG